MASDTIEQTVLLRFKADTGGLERGTRAAKKAAGDAGQAFAATAKQTNELRLGFETVGRIGSALPGQLGPMAGSVGALTSAFKGAGGSIVAFGLAATGAIGALIKFGPQFADMISHLFGAADATKAAREEIEKLRGEILKSQPLIDKLFPEEARTQQRRDQQRELSERFAKETQLATQQLTLAKAQAETALEHGLTGGPRLGILSLDPQADFDRAIADIAKRREEAFRRLDAEFKKQDDERAARAKAVADARAGLAGRGGGAGAIGSTPVELPFQNLIDLLQGQPAFGVGGGPFSETRLPTTAKIGQRGQTPGIGGASMFDAILDQQQALRDSFDGTTEAMSVMEQGFGTLAGAAGDAWGAFLEGEASLKGLTKRFGQSLKGISAQLFGEGILHTAMAIGESAFGRPDKALLHSAAAKVDFAGSAITGALGVTLGALGGGTSGGHSGGGRLPGAASGAFGPPGGGGGRTEVIYISNPFDDSPRQTRKRVSDALARTQREQGASTTVIRE